MLLVKNFIPLLAFVVLLSIISTKASFSSNQFHNIDENLVVQYSKDKYWAYLLHYNNNKSNIGYSSFFLSKTEREEVDLELELKKTLEAFFNRDHLDDSHAICKYPARFNWIKSTFHLNDNLFPKPLCKELDHYLRSISAKKIYISFASENLKNPTSMMGHPFLKIEGNKNGHKIEHSVTYFGDYGTENILKFYAKSITSGVKGIFLVEPYRKKLNFYNDEQKRTIWEFEINLNKEQINNLILHIWELYRIDVKYHFIFHNCVSALIDLLKVAGIDNIKSNILITPIEMIDEMHDMGYISNDVSLYPSYDYQFRIISNLTDDEKKKINEIVSDYDSFNKKIDGKNFQADANILFASKIALQAKSLDNSDQKQQYINTISKIDERLKKLPKHNLRYDTKNPFSRNRTSQVAVGYGREAHENVTKLEFYPVYNSFQNDNSNYLNEFELKLLSFESKYYQKSERLRVDKINLLKIQSIIDSNEVIGGWSSGLNINFERENNLPDTSKLYPNFEVSIGKAKQILSNNVLLYFLISPGYSYYQGNNNLYVYPEIGFFIRNINSFKTHFKYRKYFSDNDYKYKESLSIEEIFFITKNHSAIFELENIRSDFDNVRKLYLKYQYSF